MRSLLLIFVLPACAADPSTTPGDPTPSSLRERLAAAPARMLVSPTASFGSIEVGHYSAGMWQRSRVPLTIVSGAVTTSLDDTGGVIVSELGVGFADFALPISQNTELTHVRLDLKTPIAAATTWADEDSATAMASIPLALAWTLDVDGTATPLGDQLLPALPVQLELGGDGEGVAGTALVTASGKVWSWADLVELDDLSLTLQVASID